jgi:hypothetical protein
MHKLVTTALVGAVTAGSLLVATEAAQASGPGKPGSTASASKGRKSTQNTRTISFREPFSEARLKASLAGRGDGEFDLKVTYGPSGAVNVFPVTVRGGEPSLINPFTKLTEAAGHTNIHKYIAAYTNFAPDAAFSVYAK